VPVIDAATFRRMCAARDRLRSTEEPAPAVRKVAAEISMSTFHFIRLFRAMFGETPHQLRMRARLERAKEQLALDDHSVTTVSLDAGFSSLGSFSDLFARRVGVPPSVFRQDVRGRMAARDELPKEMTPDCLSLMVSPAED
jgi:AraC-like DNA-binding protein